MEWNIKAVTWFVHKIWPAIRRGAQGARFRICGPGMTYTQQREWAEIDGVDPVGFVEDLREEYRRCALSVAPIHGGAGTKIKVLEAFKFGRTQVATSHALRGLDRLLRNQEALLIGDEPAAFAKAVIRLMGDPERRQAMAESGQHALGCHFTFARFADAVAESVADVLELSRRR
jgi:glycosyltransferase involved in cell wall biosynthesis